MIRDEAPASHRQRHGRPALLGRSGSSTVALDTPEPAGMTEPSTESPCASAGGAGKPDTGMSWRDGYGHAALRGGQTLLLAAAVALVVWVLIRLRLVVVPTLIATMVAAAVWPLVGWLRARRVPHALAAWTALLTGVGGLTALGWIVVVGIQGEWDELRSGVADGLDQLEQFLTSGPLDLDPAQVQNAQDAVVDAASGEEARAQAVTGATLATEVLAGAFLTLVVLFFLLKDGPRIWAFLTRLLPPEQQPRARRIGDRSVGVLGGYVRGTTLVAVVDAVLIGLGLLLLGVPLALPLAVVVFLGAFIPLAGATVAGAVAAVIALVTNGPVTALLVVALVIAVNQVEGDVLAPLVLGKALSLHPLVILLGLSAGAIVAGVIGALLAVPAVAVGWTAVTAWNDDPADPPPNKPRGPGSRCGRTVTTLAP
jgi:predicted PurR-regulated permease PerM